MSDTLLPVESPIDLSNCEREPIHIPGSVQPHGVLLTVAAPDGAVQQVSANCASLLGRPPEEVLGASLREIFHADAADLLESAMTGGRTSTPGTPLHLLTSGPEGELQWVDVLVHRSGEVWVVELEPSSIELSVGNTLVEVREAVAELSSTSTLGELVQVAVEQVRTLTGFDRVMCYRFDEDWNGVVAAEAKREDLESFRGLHYPAGDIPPQARALYTVNWLRFIRDVDAVNVPLVPVQDPRSGAPMDLSLATLRSVSPIHCEYLRNMGVTASMSVSLVIDGALAGLIACHHYSGPFVPSAPVRATCEFLAQTLSLMLGGRERDDRLTRSREIQRSLSTVTLATGRATADLSLALERHAPGLLGMVGATGMVWTLEGRQHAVGEVPERPDVERLRTWARAQPAVDGLVHSSSVPREDPSLADLADLASGLLMLQVAEDQDVVFLRPEEPHTVDWGGNPHLKVLQVDEDGVSRLSPRGSFALWRETVRERSLAWEAPEIEAAAGLRTHLVQLLYERNRALAGVAETLQRSLLPDSLPSVRGWSLAADYEPASLGVGGDWYDAVVLPSGRLLVVVGDVAGHGLVAAGAMGQLRNALRAYAVEDEDPASVLTRLDRMVSLLSPEAMATAAVGLLDPATGRIHLSSAGHPTPVLCRRSRGECGLVVVEPGPPLGAGSIGSVLERTVGSEVMEPGDALLLCSDGMFERRDEAVDVSLEQLSAHVLTAIQEQPDAGSALAWLVEGARPSISDDDATVLLLARD